MTVWCWAVPWQEVRGHQELELDFDVVSLVPENLSGGGYCFARSLPLVKLPSFLGVGLMGLADTPLNVSIKNRGIITGT